MNDDYRNNAVFERPSRGGGRALLFPENRGLLEAIDHLRHVSLNEDVGFDRGSDKGTGGRPVSEANRRIEEEIVSHAKFLVPIDVWNEDLTRGADGSLSIRDGASFAPCGISFSDGSYSATTYTYLPLFTDWDELYMRPYPGHVHAMVVTFEDCLRLVKESGEGRGIAINPGSQRLYYESEDLVRFAALRESLLKDARVDGDWTFGPRGREHQNVVLRGTQNRVRLYLPGRFGADGRIAGDGTDESPDAVPGVCFSTVPLVSGTGEQLREVLRALPMRGIGLGAWEVYAKADCDTPLLMGRILCERNEPGAVKIWMASESCPSTDLIYCEFLSEGVLQALEDAGGQLASGYAKYLQKAMRYCALDNTYLTGCSYAYSGEEAARERAVMMTERGVQDAATTVAVTMPMLLLGALLTYVTRVALWPGVWAAVGCLFFLMVLPVVVSERVLHHVRRSRSVNAVHEQMADGYMPSEAQHHARFSMRPDCVLYCDEERELRGNGPYDIGDAEHFLFVFSQDGVAIPVAKSAL
ncbi:MAG: SseB family protein [Atopobiaceae bacterium]|nr:SseB family protein [Atopobiaceae bacterium]